MIALKEFADADAIDGGAEAVGGLALLYESERVSMPLGAVARPREGRVGDDIDRAAMTRLGRVEQHTRTVNSQEDA